MTKLGKGLIKGVKSALQKKRKPRCFNPGQYKHADISESFKAYDVEIPACIYVNCDELSLKQARKLAVWLKKAIDYLERKGA